MSDTPSDFRRALAEAGLAPGEVVADGALHRCPTTDKPQARDGWYVLHPDPPASGAFGNWRTGFSDTWTATEERTLTPQEREHLRQRIEADRKARVRAEQERHAEAAAKARSILAEAPDCQAHEYLTRKKVAPCAGLKLARDGRLVAPVLGADGKAQSVQFIDQAGGKRFLTGGKVAGGFFAIKGKSGPLFLVEGVATGLTVAEATGRTVLCAFNAGNLLAMARMARKKYPERPIIVAADNDTGTDGNPGLTAATAAALDVSGKLAVPAFPESAAGTDFNDLAAVAGLEEVKRQLAESREPEAAKVETGPATQHEAEQIEAALAEVNPSWPVLSPEALPGLAGDFVALATEYSEADPAAVLATLLARFGIECGPDSHIMVGDAPHYPRLFAAVVGASAKSRKGTSGAPVQRLFDAKPEDYTLAKTSPGPLSTGEGLVYRVRDARQEWQVNKKTGEGRWVEADPGENDKRLFVLDEELAGALHSTARQGNTLSTILRSLWDSGDCEPLTKTNPTKCTRAHVGVVTHITEAELGKLLSETETLNGFANRFLWVFARRNKLVAFPQPMPETELERLRRGMFGAVQKARAGGEVRMDESARDLWGQVYADLSQDSPGLAGCVVNRAEAQVTRLSLVYALLAGRRIIEAEHLRAALALWDYARASALRVFGGRGDNPLQARVLDLLKAGPMSTTEMHRALKNHTRGLRDALTSLLNSGRIEKTEKPSGGVRPQLVFSLANFANFANFIPAPSQTSQSSQSSQGEMLNLGGAAPLPDVVEL